MQSNLQPITPQQRNTNTPTRTPPGPELVGPNFSQHELDVLVTEGADDVERLTGYRPYVKARLAKAGDFATLVRHKFGVRYDGSWREWFKAWKFEPLVQLASLQIGGWYDSGSRTFSLDTRYIPDRPWDGLRNLIFHELMHAWQHERYGRFWQRLEDSYSRFYAEQSADNSWQLYSFSALIEGHAVYWEAQSRKHFYPDWATPDWVIKRERPKLTLKKIGFGLLALPYVPLLKRLEGQYTHGSAIVAALQGQPPPALGSHFIDYRPVELTQVEATRNEWLAKQYGSGMVEACFEYPELAIPFFSANPPHEVTLSVSLRERDRLQDMTKHFDHVNPSHAPLTLVQRNAPALL